MIDGDSEKAKADMFVSGENRYVAEQDNFSKIPSSPVAYWVSDQFLKSFESPKIGDFVLARNGMKTGDNGNFVRLWWEPNIKKEVFNAKNAKNAVESKGRWFPYNKGGEYRKWYGNNDCVVNWENAGERVIGRAKIEKRNVQDYPIELKFKPLVTWSLITSSLPSFRYKESCICDIAGMSFWDTKGKNTIPYLLALCNSKVAFCVLKMIAPTINFQAGDISRIPVIISTAKGSCVQEKTEQCISLSKSDWDSFETSWDFAEHPLVKWSHDLWDCTAIAATMDYYYHGERPEVSCPVELCYLLWQGECNDRFAKLKANEEELNRIFIDIYGLQDELTPEVEDKDVTVRRADLGRDIRSLLSYAVGCILGRYSLDKPGLAYAGGEWDSGKYSRFQPVTDNVVPLCDEEYFGEDDLVNRVVDFIKEVFGAASLEENLAFIAKALGNKGNTSREVIRNYFLKDFFADHCKIYQKRPIYWMFDSGKKNGFKALVYLHRWDADTTGRVNNNYLSPLLRTYAQQIVQENNVISASSDARTVSLAQKRLDKLKLQQAECEKYEKNIAHLAGLRIALDLDDGVKVNYVKAQTAADGKNLNVLAPLK